MGRQEGVIRMNSNLSLFFTYGISVEDWNKNGSLDRELNIYSKLTKQFETIYFITYGRDDLKYKKQMPKGIVILPKKWNIPHWLYSFLIPFAYPKELKSSILKTNQILGSWSAVLSKWIHKRKLVVRTGYTDSKFVKRTGKKIKYYVIRLIEWFGFKNADEIIITTLFDVDYLVKSYGVKKSNITVIQNHIDTNKFKSVSYKKNKRDILFIGRLNEQKNILNLLDALSNENYAITLVGSGELKEQVIKKIKEFNLNVILIDKVENSKLPVLFAKHKLLVLPSLYEGNPKLLLEAMACKMPCIGTNVEGIEEIIIHKKNGIMCEINPQAIKRAIRSTIKEPALLKSLGENARKTVLSNNSLEQNIKREIELYENL